MGKGKEFRHGNVGARIDTKKGREVCLFRVFEDGGGEREFTLWLSTDEAENAVDALDALLGWKEDQA